MRNIIIILAFIFSSQIIHSQFGYQTVETIYIQYNGTLYVMPRGIKKFLQDVPMDNVLREELNQQYKTIRKKQGTFYAVSLGGTAVGGTIFLSSLAKTDGNDDFPVAAGVGVGIILGSAITAMVLKAKKKDYRKFVNTYNAYVLKKKKIRTDFSINLSKDNNGIGVCLTF